MHNFMERNRILSCLPTASNPIFQQDDLVTGLAPWEFEFLFPGSLISTFLDAFQNVLGSWAEPVNHNR
jgi:hypothetical protein